MWLLSHADWVRISLDAIGIDLYEHIRGGIPVEAVRRSIALMGEQGVNVQFGITMSKLNYLELPALADYAKHIGATSFRVWPVRNNPALEVPSAQGITVLTKCRQIVNTMDNNIVDAINILLYGESTEFDHCFACLFQMFVDATGDIYPCCIHAGDAMDSPQNTHTFGNIMETDLDMVYCFAKEFSRSNKLPEACKGCTKRLQTINHLSASRWNDKHFI
jgi:radical SAM protein with 4Fe4S-binding SPASM domain